MFNKKQLLSSNIVPSKEIGIPGLSSFGWEQKMLLITIKNTVSHAGDVLGIFDAMLTQPII